MINNNNNMTNQDDAIRGVPFSIGSKSRMALAAVMLSTIPASGAFAIFSSSKSSRNSRLNTVKIPDWSALQSPPSNTDGRRFGPNWTTDPATLGPLQQNGTCGTLTWAIGDSTYVHPESRTDLPVGKWLQKRRNLGIAMSGGGLRAAVCAIGWLRALQQAGVLHEAKFFSANSGGTWTTLPLFSKQILDKKDFNLDMDYDEWLGDYIEPSQITMAKDELGKMGVVMSESNVLFGLIGAAIKMLNPFSGIRHTPWAESIKNNFYVPVVHGCEGDDFWLEVSEAYLWNTRSHADLLNQRNTLPYPVFVASCSRGIQDHQIFPLEMSPLYVGIPVNPDRLVRRTPLGGGFIQGPGFNAHCVQDDKDGVPVDKKAHFVKNLNNPDPVVKLFEITAASSNFGASAVALTQTWLFKWLTPKFYGILKFTRLLAPGEYDFWSPNKGDKPVKIDLVDGGLLDNLGVLAQLRRGVSTLIVCNSAAKPIDKDKQSDWVNDFSDLASLFGVMGSTLPAGFRWLQKKSYTNTINGRSKVFAEEEFDILMKEMMAKQDAGKPLVVRKTMHVNANVEAGIYKDFDVDVIWCFNGASSDWSDQLQGSAKKFADDNKDWFPYFSTTNTAYTQDQTNMLAHISCFQLSQGLKDVGFNVKKVARS